MKKVWEEPTYVSPPIARIPVKTNLSDVLLLTNPWEQRDLDRKLAHISKDRRSRAKSLKWSQRHFFVQQIFDSDYNLRFTKQRETFSEELKNKYRKKPKVVEKLAINPGREEKITNSSVKSEKGSDSKSKKEQLSGKDYINDSNTRQLGLTCLPEDSLSEHKRLPKLPALIPTAQGAGIFLPRRQERKGKLNTSNNFDGQSIEEWNTAPENEKTTVDETVLNSPRVTSLPAIGGNGKPANRKLLTDPVLMRSSQPNNSGGKHRSKHKKLQMSPSFPKISTSVKGNFSDFSTENSASVTESPTKQTTVTANVSDAFDASAEKPDDAGGSDLGEGDVISDITSKLPMSLMIKANQQVNKVVLTRKQKWIRKSKEINENTKSLLSDPRYENLTKVLRKPSPSDFVDDQLPLED